MNLNGYLEDSKKPLVSLVLVLPSGDVLQRGVNSHELGGAERG